MNKVNKYDIEYEIARVYPYTRCDEYSHAWECHQATVYSYYSENLKYYAEGKLTLERINEWLKLPEENNKLVRRKDGKDIYLHKNDYQSPFHMEYFVRRHSKGYYLYKNRVFRLANLKEWNDYGDGYYEYTPYFKRVVNLDTITTI